MKAAPATLKASLDMLEAVLAKMELEVLEVRIKSSWLRYWRSERSDWWSFNSPMCFRTSDISSNSPEEANRVPVPFNMHDVGIEADQVVRGHQMVRENALAPCGDVDLLSPFLQVHLGGSSILTQNVDGGEGEKVGDKVAFAQLVDLFLNWNNFKGTKLLGNLKLLHIQ